MQAKSLSPTTTLRPTSRRDTTSQPNFWWTYLRRTIPEDVKKVMNAVKGPTQDAVDRATGSRQPIRGAGKDLNVRVSNFDPMETSGSEGVEPNYYFTVMRQNLKTSDSLRCSVSSVQSAGVVARKTLTVVVAQPIGCVGKQRLCR